MTSANQYIVNIYLILDSGVAPRVHLSNPALYVTQANTSTVLFTDPTNSLTGWTIVFNYGSPFCTKAGAPVNQVNQGTGALYLTQSALQLTYTKDFNYTITIPATLIRPAVTEDPQVIIGGKGGRPLGGWGGVAIGAGLAGLLAGILGYRMIAGRD